MYVTSKEQELLLKVKLHTVQAIATDWIYGGNSVRKLNSNNMGCFNQPVKGRMTEREILGEMNMVDINECGIHKSYCIYWIKFLAKQNTKWNKKQYVAIIIKTMLCFFPS